MSSLTRIYRFNCVTNIARGVMVKLVVRILQVREGGGEEKERGASVYLYLQLFVSVNVTAF